MRSTDPTTASMNAATPSNPIIMFDGYAPTGATSRPRFRALRRLAGFRVCRLQLPVEDAERGLCLVRRNARLESCGEFQVARVARGRDPRPGEELRLHHQRRVERGREGAVGARESLRRHADNGERMSVQINGASDQRRVTSKSTLPEREAEDRDRMFTRHL